MFRHLTVPLLALSLLTVAIPAWANTVPSVHYQYEQSGEETLDYWISGRSLRMDIRQGSTTSTILFRTQESPEALYLLEPSRKLAQKVTKQGINELVQALNKRMELTLDQMPPEQRQRIESALDSTRARVAEVPSPEFRATRSTTWQGMKAMAGEFHLNGEKRGLAILLDTPPVSLPEGSEQVMGQFQSLLGEFVGLLKGMPGRGGGSSLEKTENLLGTQYLRLAEFEAENRWIRLRSWTSKRVEETRFNVPTDYRVVSVGSMMSSGF